MPPDSRQDILKVLNRLRLRMVDAETDQNGKKFIRIFPDDLQYCSLSRDTFYTFLANLKEKGVIDVIETLDPDEGAEGWMDPGGYPELFAGYWKVYLPGNFETLSARLISELECSTSPAADSHTTEVPTDNRIKVYVSRTHGIYRDHDTREPIYHIKRDRAKIVWLLRDGRKTGSMLVDLTHYKNGIQAVSQAINAINKNFRSKLEFENDLIERIPTGGYELNCDAYNIEFVDDT